MNCFSCSPLFPDQPDLTRINPDLYKSVINQETRFMANGPQVVCPARLKLQDMAELDKERTEEELRKHGNKIESFSMEDFRNTTK